MNQMGRDISFSAFSRPGSDSRDGHKRQLLWAPLRLLGGFFIGGFLTAVAFLFVWIDSYGLDVLGLSSGLGLMTPVVGAVVFALFYGTKPIDSVWKLVLLVVVAGLAGTFLGVSLERAVAESCGRRLSMDIPAPGLCAAAMPRLGVLWHAVAAGFLGLIAGFLGTHVSPPPAGPS